MKEKLKTEIRKYHDMGESENTTYQILLGKANKLRKKFIVVNESQISSLTFILRYWKQSNSKAK